MIIFEFDREECIKYCEELANEEFDPNAIWITGFDLSMRLIIDSIDLFDTQTLQTHLHNQPVNMILRNVKGIENSYWITAPLVNFASHGIEAIHDVMNGKSVNLEIPEAGNYLRMQPNGNQIVIFSTINKKMVEVDSNELLCAFKDFLMELRSLIIQEIPNIVDNPDFYNWFNTN